MLFYTILIILALLLILSFVFNIRGSSQIHGNASFSRNKLLSRKHTGWVIDGTRAIDRDLSFTHALVLAPSGSGKTTAGVLPNILMADNCSLIITDVKGEIYDISSATLQAKGFRVLTLDLSEPERSVHYNPLQRVASESDIQNLAQSFYDMANSGVKSEGIWRMGAIRLLSIFIACLKNMPDQRYANIASLITLLDNTDNGSSHVHDFVMKYAPNQEAIDRWTSFANQEVKIAKGQLSSAIACLVAFQSREALQITAQDTIDFHSIRKQKTALFLKLPVGKNERLVSVLSLFYADLFRYLLNEPLTERQLDLLVTMDEFGVLHKLPNFDKTISLIRSKRVGLMMVLQNIEQLKHTYGEHIASTIIANTSSILAYSGIRDEATLKLLTRLGGKTTKEVVAPGTYYVQTIARDLINADQIRTMPRSRGLFIHGNHYPQWVSPLPLYKNKLLMEACGIQSFNGSLQAEYIVEQPITSLQEIPRLPLQEQESPEVLDLKQQLDELLAPNRSTDGDTDTNS